MDVNKDDKIKNTAPFDTSDQQNALSKVKVRYISEYTVEHLVEAKFMSFINISNLFYDYRNVFP